MRGPATLPALVAAVLLTACTPDRSCTEEEKKDTVLEIARTWYLFPELLDPSVGAASYPDAESMLVDLVAPAEAAGKDGGWSFLSTISETRTYFDEGKMAGYGFGLLVRGTAPDLHLRVAQVFPGSAVDEAGFERGDEILRIGTDEATLVPASEILAANDGWIGDSLGPPSTEGVTRVFEVQTLAAAEPVIRTVTTRVFDLAPVDRRIVGNVGIVLLRSFIRSADDGLRAVMNEFRAAGVTDVVVDVRYNGGGLVSTAQLLANLLSAGHPGERMYTVRYNAAHSSYDENVAFAPPVEAVQPLRIAFITTDATASASELVPNVIEPYLGGAGIALVGAHTYGKPVGQLGWNISTCGDVLYLVSFQLVNSQGEGDYFFSKDPGTSGGLPDAAGAFSGPLCPAEDDLTQEQGSTQEASTAAALYWLANGACPGTAGTSTLSAMASVPPPQPDRYPAPTHPSLAQRENPGLF